MKSYLIFVVLSFTSIQNSFSFHLDFQRLNFINNPTDTIKGYFLFESRVDGYIEGSDAVLKEGGFVKFEFDNIESIYRTGYYLVNPNNYRKIVNENFEIDSASVLNLYNRLTEIYWIQENVENDFNPFCGVFFRKFYLEIITVDLGLLSEKIPYLLDCEDLETTTAKTGVKYQSIDIPNFAILKVLNWCEY